jgi:hypothetical protein
MAIKASLPADADFKKSLRSPARNRSHRAEPMQRAWQTHSLAVGRAFTFCKISTPSSLPSLLSVASPAQCAEPGNTPACCPGTLPNLRKIKTPTLDNVD